MYAFIPTSPVSFQLRIPKDWPRDDFMAISRVGDALREGAKGEPVRGHLYWGAEEDGRCNIGQHIAYFDLHWDQNVHAMDMRVTLGGDYKRETPTYAPSTETTPPVRTERRMNFRRR